MLDELAEFLDREKRRLLIVDPNLDRRQRLVQLWADSDIEVLATGDGSAIPGLIEREPIDCVIVDAESAVRNPLSSVRRPLPVIVYAESASDGDADGAFAGYGERSEISWRTADGDILPVHRVASPERLLDQATFCLHLDLSKLPETQRRLLAGLHSTDKVLAGKKALIVDDDIRNIFALSSVLEEHDMFVISADNGRDAIRILQQQQDIDIVLMDIMMPELDGLDTMRELRKNPRLKSLPIIAVTAKAMKGDREKCIEAGAWDYLSKPVDSEQMLAVMRAWLRRGFDF
jgi:CheY-like chemotaxis protein